MGACGNRCVSIFTPQGLPLDGAGLLAPDDQPGRRREVLEQGGCLVFSSVPAPTMNLARNITCTSVQETRADLNDMGQTANFARL